MQGVITERPRRFDLAVLWVYGVEVRDIYAFLRTLGPHRGMVK